MPAAAAADWTADVGESDAEDSPEEAEAGDAEADADDTGGDPDAEDAAGPLFDRETEASEFSPAAAGVKPDSRPQPSTQEWRVDDDRDAGAQAKPVDEPELLVPFDEPAAPSQPPPRTEGEDFVPAKTAGGLELTREEPEGRQPRDPDAELCLLRRAARARAVRHPGEAGGSPSRGERQLREHRPARPRPRLPEGVPDRPEDARRPVAPGAQISQCRATRSRCGAAGPGSASAGTRSPASPSSVASTDRARAPGS